MRESLLAGGYAGALLAGLGGVVWATGLPALFPSLGPSAFVLVTRPDAPESRPRRGSAVTRSASSPAWPPTTRWPPAPS